MVCQLYQNYTQENNPYYNLAVEQYLMERVAAEEVILYLWQNAPTVVIGRNQSPYLECTPNYLASMGIHLVRRLSGGGAVYHDLGNLNFSFLAQKGSYNVQKQLAVVAAACESLGIPVQCTGRNDIVSGDRKFSGNAFYEHNQRCCHHGTLLVNVDMAAMEKCLTPSKAKLSAKGIASVRSRVVNLKDLRPELTIEELAGQMKLAFAAVYGVTPTRLSGEDFVWGSIDALTKRNQSWEWLFGANVPFTYQCGGRFSWGEIILQFATGRGIVEQIAVFSDAMDWRISGELIHALKGRYFRADDLQAHVMAAELDETVKRDVSSLLKDI